MGIRISFIENSIEPNANMEILMLIKNDRCQELVASHLKNYFTRLLPFCGCLFNSLDNDRLIKVGFVIRVRKYIVIRHSEEQGTTRNMTLQGTRYYQDQGTTMNKAECDMVWFRKDICLT